MNLVTLSRAWLDAKEREAAANADRVAIEQSLLGLVGELPEEGQRTFKADVYAIEMKQALYVKPKDSKVFLAAAEKGIIPATFVQPSLYDTAVKQVRRAAMKQEGDAIEVYSSILPYLNVTPAKTGVKVVKLTN